MRKLGFISILFVWISVGNVTAQIDTDRMTIIGRNALYFEDYILAIQYFNQIIRVKPYLAEPYYYRALGKYYLEDYRGAQNDCNLAIERNPYFVDAYNLRGILNQKMEDPRSAIRDFSRGLEIDPRNINLTINLGIGYIQTEDYEKAIEVYTHALDLSPNLISAWLNRGLARLSMKDTAQALSDFTKAIALNPYIPDGFVNRAMIYYHRDEFDLALQDMEKALKLKPDDPSLYMNRGILRYQLDDLQGTLEDFDKVIELEPRNAMAYNNRGILRAEIGDLNRAIDDFSRVLALRGDDMLTLYYRGMLYKETGEYQKALSDFNFVANEYPDFGPVYYNRAEIKQLLGRQEDAQLDYNTAMKLEMTRRENIGKADRDQQLARNDSDKDNDKGKKKEGRKATREESDRNINNYNKIAVLDDFGNEQAEMISGSSLRGKIQNRNIIIDLEPQFGLSFFAGDTLVHRVRYYNREVERFNRFKMFARPLEITNQMLEPDRETSALIFKSIEQTDARLKNIGNASPDDLYLERGLLYLAVLNLNNAIENYNRIIARDSTNYLAWFSRAYARYKMVEIVKDFQSQTPPEADELNLSGVQPPGSAIARQEQEQKILDYEVILSDLNQVTLLKPDFAFAWFNMGYIKSLLRDFEVAKEDFSRAIQANPDFGEAYFNRGLIRLFLEETTAGTLDLSKAGELGIYEAYSVIKRYGAETFEPEKSDKEESNE